MRCAKVRKLISTSLDEELDEVRSEALRAHLAGCPKCEAFAADLARLEDRLDLVAAPEPRWGFAGRVSARIADLRSGEASAPRWHGSLRPAWLGLSAAAFVLGVVVAVLASSGPGAEASPQDDALALLAGDYFDTLAEDAVDQRLMALLPSTEK